MTPAEIVESWFALRSWAPFTFQREAWNAYLAGRDGLVHSATGTGKTLAVWLGPILEWLSDSPRPWGRGVGGEGGSEKGDKTSSTPSPAAPRHPLPKGRGSLLARFFLSIGPIRENVIAQSRWLHELPAGKLFDVGCGSGEFLQSMRDLGWQVSGLEPDDRAAEEARKKGFTVTTSAIEELNEPPGQYDVVTMVHVIEHLLDAKAVLKKLLALLKPGGLLMMVTPNVQSLSAKMFGPSWFGWEIPRHIHMYSPQSLLATIMGTGFGEARVHTTSHSASGMWRLSRHIREHGSVPNMQAGFQPWLWFPSGYFQIREYLRCRYKLEGEELIAFARK